MRIIGYGLTSLALFFYAKTVQATWVLVSESRRAKPDARFSRIWWLPAWSTHRTAYPESPARKQIVQFFAATFFFMLAGMGFMAIDTLNHLHHHIPPR